MEIQGGNIISQIKRLSDRIFDRILSEQKIDAFNGAQGRILYVLWQEEMIPFRELADRTGLAVTTLTSMIDRMEAADLVRRIPDREDRRKTLLSLTENARNLKKPYTDVSDRMTGIFYEGFSEEEIGLCEEFLRRIHSNLKQQDSIPALKPGQRQGAGTDVKRKDEKDERKCKSIRGAEGKGNDGSAVVQCGSESCRTEMAGCPGNRA